MRKIKIKRHYISLGIWKLRHYVLDVHGLLFSGADAAEHLKDGVRECAACRDMDGEVHVPSLCVRTFQIFFNQSIARNEKNLISFIY